MRIVKRLFHPSEETAMKQKHPPARFADWNNLPKPRWRDALVALAGPATRVHQYRNLRSAAFYAATCDLDCKEAK